MGAFPYLSVEPKLYIYLSVLHDLFHYCFHYDYSNRMQMSAVFFFSAQESQYFSYLCYYEICAYMRTIV